MPEGQAAEHAPSLLKHSPNGATKVDDSLLAPHVIHPSDVSVEQAEMERAFVVASPEPASSVEPKIQTDRESRRKHQLKALIATAFVLAALVCIVATLPGLWVLVGTIVMGLSFTWRRGANHRELITVLCAITVGITAVDYLSWRAAVTNWGGWEIAAPLLAAEIFGGLHTLGLQYTVWPSTGRGLVRSENVSQRPIFVLIPTVNEGSSVLTPTIHGALEARRRYLAAFPSAQVTIVLCNDSRVAGVENWREVEDLAHRLGVMCVTRTAPGGNKAGNLEHVRQEVRATGDALVAIFDADQIAKPDFLLKTVPPFADPTVGWVQTGQYYGNLEQPVARWANDQQALFYRVLCPGKAAQNAAFICGTNVVIRATALDQIGGLPQDSVTEDFAASIQLHPRWRSVFLTEVLAVGLGPMDLPAFLKQQRRWAIGTIGVLRTHWRAILLPRRGGLRFEQRIQYALACTHYICGLRDLIYVVSPLAFLVSGIPAVRGASLGLFLWHFLPYWIASQVAFWFAARRQTGLRGIIMGFASFPVLLRALLAVMLGRRGGFTVTSKRRRGGRSWRHLSVYAAVLAGCCVVIVLALGERRLRSESMTISILWVVYDIALLASVLWLGITDLRFKESTVNRRGKLDQLAVGSVRSMWRADWIPSLPSIHINGDRLRGARRVRFSPSSRAVRRPLALAVVLLLGCCCAGVLLAFGGRRLQPNSVANSIFWLIYELALLAIFSWIGIRQARFAGAAIGTHRDLNRIAFGRSSRRRPAWSFRPRIAVNAHRPRTALGARFTPSTRAVRPTVVLVVALVLAISVVPRLSFPTTPDRLRLAASRGPGQPPSLGLSLPQQVLTTRPHALQTRLCLPFVVIGRTQDIGDSFDVAWANRLSGQNQQPWITLQFANFSADGKVPLTASLLAIANGVQDANIQRWARDIHGYGKPVYLTILLHADRNWSISSGVANGGIPQDVPRAWQHVQSIFKSVGDMNVAWVWSPADPAHDQAYAPPESTIDVVLQSMIRYPGTPWPDPAAVLSSVGERHPTKPLFLEVSGAGLAAERADWLKQVGSAVTADPQVYALLYHEGAPDVRATAAENANWSVESDVSSMKAMLTWRSLIPTVKLPCQSSPLSSPEAA